jgi:hypothetical protein
MPLAFSRDQIPEIRTAAELFMNQVREIAHRAPKNTDLFHVLVHVFPFTKPDRE